MYSILFTVCEVAFDNFFIKEFYDDDDDVRLIDSHCDLLSDTH